MLPQPLCAVLAIGQAGQATDLVLNPPLASKADYLPEQVRVRGLIKGWLSTAGMEAAHAAAEAPRARKTREGKKQAMLIAMLRAEGGAAIAEIVAATGWQSHTVRGAMSGALKKELGLEVTSEKGEGRGRVYRLPPD